jgi:hypothetical protein
MAQLSLNLQVTDVDGNLIDDPTVFVRVTARDSTVSATKKVSLRKAMLPLRFENGPPGFAVLLRVTPSRYMDGAIICTVDGDGVIRPAGQIVLPRRSAEWRPSFTPWQGLPGPFGSLQTILDKSPEFRLGRTSDPERLVETHYDQVDPDDESRVLAKSSLLNLYSRLRMELIPGAGKDWFSMVQEMLVATRERFIAQVDEECWAHVRAFALHPPEHFNSTPSELHRKNFEAIPGVTQVTDLASVKTEERRANLQFTVCRAVRNGKPVFLLDTDIDENGSLLRHTFDLVKHIFNGGTHPLDIHEALRKKFPEVTLGYQLEPRVLLPDSAARGVASVIASAGPIGPVGGVTGV